MKVEAKDIVGKWLPATVLKTRGADTRYPRRGGVASAFVSFDGWDSEYDEWIAVQERRMRKTQDASASAADADGDGASASADGETTVVLL